jgi:transcriptional regulator with XRE-family HTH domain
MDQQPGPPPEGKLIAEALTRLNLSIREASRRAGISYGRWRQITTGVQHVSPGSYAAVRDAPARTIARMAAVAGVTPGELAAAGRRDAAEALEEITAAAGHPPAVSAPAFVLERARGERFPDHALREDPDLQELADAWSPRIEAAVLRAMREHPEVPIEPLMPLEGRWVFPGDPHLAGRWDAYSEQEPPWSLWQRARACAVSAAKRDLAARRPQDRPRR